jgi:hypothetical protein
MNATIFPLQKQQSPPSVDWAGFRKNWWRFRDLNSGPSDYDSAALTD